MATRKPIVMVEGELQELAAADSTGGKSEWIGVFATKTGTQALVDGAASSITFDGEDFYDDAEFHDKVLQNSRITIPADYNKARFSVGIQLDTSVARAVVEIYKNGTPYAYLGKVDLPAAVATPTFLLTTPYIPVAEGDYFEVFVTSHGAANNVVGANSFFQMESTLGNVVIPFDATITAQHWRLGNFKLDNVVRDRLDIRRLDFRTGATRHLPITVKDQSDTNYPNLVSDNNNTTIITGVTELIFDFGVPITPDFMIFEQFDYSDSFDTGTLEYSADGTTWIPFQTIDWEFTLTVEEQAHGYTIPVAEGVLIKQHAPSLVFGGRTDAAYVSDVKIPIVLGGGKDLLSISRHTLPIVLGKRAEGVSIPLHDVYAIIDTN